LGLSIAISGGIVTFTIIYVMMTFPTILDDTTKISMSSTQMSSTLNSIMHTNLNVSSLANISGTNTVTFSVTNTGNTILWNYKEFDTIVTYQANIDEKYTEVLHYNSNCGTLTSGQWCIQSISNDLTHPGILDPKEKANVLAELQHSTFLGGTFTLNFGTDNGVMDTSSVIMT
jgi:Conserved flagellar protein F, immunoglobulin-like domain